MDQTPGKFLGIDYGTKRIGLALSDERGRLAFPKTIIKNDAKAIGFVGDLIQQEGVKAIVIGESLSHQGLPNPVAQDIEKFILALEPLGLPVAKEKEFLTSVEARHHMSYGGQARRSRPGAKADAAAAALILQRYLDRKNS